MIQPSDTECVGRCRRGDREAYRVLMERYERVVLAYARGRMGTGGGMAGVEEVVQEAFVRAYLRLKELKKPESFGAWVIGIAGRVMQERWRETQREIRAMREMRWQIGGERQEEGKEGEAVDWELERAVAELGKPYREVVLLRYFGGLSCAEVAERLGMPLGSVTKVLSRAYGMLREKLERQARSERTGCSYEM